MILCFQQCFQTALACSASHRGNTLPRNYSFSSIIVYYRELEGLPRAGGVEGGGACSTTSPSPGYSRRRGRLMLTLPCSYKYYAYTLTAGLMFKAFDTGLQFQMGYTPPSARLLYIDTQHSLSTTSHNCNTTTLPFHNNK